MDILIRNIDRKIITIIDERADKKGVSRNEYINEILYNFIFSTEEKLAESKYVNLVENTFLPVLENNTKALNEILRFLEKEKTNG